jgi:hypothetical protein
MTKILINNLLEYIEKSMFYSLWHVIKIDFNIYIYIKLVLLKKE